MKLGLNYVDTRKFFITDDNSSLVTTPINRGAHRQTRFGRCVSNEVNNHFVGGQWTTAPVLADEAEQTMFDLVPFAGPRGKMTDLQAQAQVVGQLL